MPEQVDDPADAALKKIAVAKSHEYLEILAKPDVHKDLKIPSQNLSPDERAEFLRQLLLNALPKLSDSRLQETAAVALRLDDATCITAKPSYRKMATQWKSFDTLHRRLALYQFTRAAEKSAATCADRLTPTDRKKIDRFSHTALRYWPMARHGLVEAIASLVQDTRKVQELIASIREESTSGRLPRRVELTSTPSADHGLPLGWTLMEARRNLEPDWHAILGGSPLSVGHLSEPKAYIERRVGADGREYDVSEVLSYLEDMRGRHVILSGDLGDGKTTYLNMLAAKSAETHIFVRWNREIAPNLDDLDEYWYHTHAIDRELEGAKPKTLVAVMELPGVVKTSVLEMISQSLEARSSDEVVVIIAGRPGPIRAVGRTGVAISRRLTLQPLNAPETWQLRTLICQAYEKVTKTEAEQARVRHLYPYLRTFYQSFASEQVYILDANANGGLIVQLLSAIYGLNVRQALVNELLNLQEADQQAYLMVCMCSVLERGIPDDTMRRMVPDAALDERALRNPWRRVNFEHYARHQVIAQIVLEELKEYYSLLTQTLARITAQIDSPDVRTLLQLLAESAPYWPQFRDEQAARDFRNCLLRALRASLAECGNLVRAVSEDDPNDRLAWGTALLRLVPRGSYTASSAASLSAAYDIIPGQAPEHLHDRATYGRIQARYRLRGITGTLSLAFTEAVRLQLETLSLEYQERRFFLRFKFFLLRHAIELLSTPSGEITEPFLRNLAVENYRELFEVYERLRYEWLSNQDIDDGDMEYFSAFTGIIARNQLFEQLPRDAMSIIYDAWQDSVRLGSPDPRLINLYVRGVIGEASERNFVVPDISKGTLVQPLIEALEFDCNYAESIFLLTLLGAEVSGAMDYARSFAEQSDVNEMKWLEPAYLQFARGLLSTDRTERSHYLLAAIEICGSTIADRPRYGRLNKEYSLRFVRNDWQMAMQMLEPTDRPRAEDLLRQIEVDISELDLADVTSAQLTEAQLETADSAEPFSEADESLDPFEAPTEYL